MNTTKSTNVAIRHRRQTVCAFYDEFNTKSLRDYVYGNRRVSAAIATVSSVINSSTKKILDIGCGIGYSSFEYCQQHPNVHVHGVDISLKSIETARALFSHERCKFDVHDVTSDTFVDRYDLIALIDVYEHIPQTERKGFNIALGECLTDEGKLVLTCPSPLHQKWLAENKPEGLQIIDETISLREISELANDIGATITFFQMVGIWRSNDYMHVIITRRPRYEPVNEKSSKQSTLLRIYNSIRRPLSRRTKADSVKSRRKRIENRLQIKI